MKFAGLNTTADIVGRRLWSRWEYELATLEAPGDMPDVLLRRKERDYEFPPLVPGDPYLVYDSAAFPPPPVPGVVEVNDLPGWETVEDGLRSAAEVVSVSEVVGGQLQETLRRVVTTTFGEDGAAIRVRVEVLDARALAPRTPYYYELDDGSAPTPEDVSLYRATAVPGGTHGLNHRLYEMLPQVYKRHDVRVMPEEAQLPGVPEASPVGGQLRRFLDMFGMGLDALRSSAENLLDVHDAHATQAHFLPSLSRMIGWEPTEQFGIPLQRNELLTATRLFNAVGTVPGLRALVTHQTGWHSQVAEFAQHVARSNEPPRRSLYCVEERSGPGGDVWQGADDASAVLDFPSSEAAGAGALPAVLTGGAIEPFALRSGMEIAIAADGGEPARVRFGAEDFVDIGAATAAEVAAAISAAFDTLSATSVGGAVELRTHAVGPDATLRVVVSPTSFLAWNEAPVGPLSAFADAEGRLRVFCEQRWTPGRTEQATFPDGSPGARAADPAEVGEERRQILYKSWAYGEWRDEHEVPDWALDATSPHAAELPDGRVRLNWVERRGQAARLRFAVGTSRFAMPAVITGRRREPFALTVGAELTLTGAFGSEVFTVLAPDYADPANATAAEVVAAMAVQLADTIPSVATGGAVRVSSVATGDDAWLRVDLSQSTAATALGLQARSIAGRGSWDPELDWTGPRAMPRAWAPVADPSSTHDPLGGARVFWSEHHAGRWEIRQAHWSERLTVVTPTGAAQRELGAWQTWQMADGLPSDDVRAVLADADGTLWFATAAGLAARRPDDVWSVLTTLDGLSSDDVRDLAFLPDGSLWCATPAGVSVVDAGGGITVLAAAGAGLIDDDVRAVAADGRGNAWAATPLGVSRLGADGAWLSWTAADGLPAAEPADLAVGEGDRVALATALGVSILSSLEGAWSTYTTAEGLPADAARGVAWGEAWDEEDVVYAATAAGLGIWDGHAWRAVTTLDGLPDGDLRAVAVAPDGTLVLGSAGGVITGHEGAWVSEGTAEGLPSDLVRGVHTTWSAPRQLATGQGGHREPRAAVDSSDRTWLVWARREEAAAGHADTWTVRLRRFDPAAATWAWEPEQAVTVSPGGTSDREPVLEPRPGGGYRVFLSTDRTGGRKLAWVELDAAAVPGALESLPDAAHDSVSPAVAPGPGGRTWVFHRSDGSVAPSQIGTLPPPGGGPRASQRVPDEGALRLRAGCVTPVLAHTARADLRRQWGELFTYTPEYPDVVSEDVPVDDFFYTRRTIGLYLRRGRSGTAVTEEQTTRLLQLLRRFLPINLRVVLIVSPEPEVELVFGGGGPTGGFEDVIT